MEQNPIECVSIVAQLKIARCLQRLQVDRYLSSCTDTKTFDEF